MATQSTSSLYGGVGYEPDQNAISQQILQGMGGGQNYPGSTPNQGGAASWFAGTSSPYPNTSTAPTAGSAKLPTDPGATQTYPTGGATDQGPEGWGWGMGGHQYWLSQHPGVKEQYPNGPTPGAPNVGGNYQPGMNIPTNGTPGVTKFPSSAPGATGAPGSLAGMSEQEQFTEAARALGIPLNQTRGRSDEIVAYLAQQGIQGWKGGGKTADDWVQTPSGAQIDYSQAGTNNFQWTPDSSGSNSGGYAMAAGGGASSGLGGPNAVQPLNYAAYGSNPMVSGAIERLLKQGQTPVSASDPNIAGATAAYKAQADTATRQSRSALAERAAQEGLNSGGAGSGAMDSAIQSQMEQEGRDVGSFSSGLVIQEIQARRQDVLNSLQFAQGEERNALTMQLAQMNDALQRAGAGQQNQQFYDSLSSGMANSSNTLNNSLLNSLLSNG